MAMAVRAAAVARPPPTSPKPTSSSKKPKSSLPPPLLSPVPTSLSLLAIFAAPGYQYEAKAFAFSKEDILNSLTQVEDTVNQVEDVGSRAVDVSLSIIKVLTETLKPGVEATLPVLRSAGEVAWRIASPVVSDASKQARVALQDAGVDPSPVLSIAKTVTDAAQQTTKVIEGAKPLASATVEKIASSEPSVIVVWAGALFLAYILLPPVWSAVSFNLRGYKGLLSPAQALDLISAQSYLMIDIRSEKDKNKSGVPRLPSTAKNKMISVPLEELPSKIKGLVRNAKKVEAEMVALKISYLKRVNKGSNIIIMDSFSDSAKIVARALTNLGFKNCWVVRDGFSGGRGWLQSRLGVDSYNIAPTEVLSPSRIIPAGRFGTSSSSAPQPARNLLPGSTNS